MNIKSLTQLKDCLQAKDVYGITILGVEYLDNGNTQEDINRGIEYIKYAGEGRNCIWAKNILFSLRGGNLDQPVSKHILIESDALEQLKIYADGGNIWAMTALGNLLFTGYSNPQNKDEGAKYLNMAADKSCYLALELIQKYGIKRVSQPAFGKIYDALKNKDYSKFWLK